ncbi:MAG: VOC family protein, partial [Candidatus Eremiobacteraeota bacterium]|nr:VOC family protein [Candidatus Eremiobacteraeota bacterium]
MSSVGITGIDATYYLTKDHERATKFYREVLGLKATVEVPGMFTEFEFPGGEAFGLYHAGEWSPSAGVMFAVPDVATAVEQLKGQGVQFDQDGEITDIPSCKMAFAEDTEGNSFILYQR